VGSSWLLYLAAATGCQAVFALFYRLVLARLTTFGWNRAYLLSALALSVALPLVALPAAWAQLVWPTGPTAAEWALPTWKLATGALPPAATAASAAGFSWLGLVLVAYWVGVAYQAWNTARNLGWLYRLRRQHPRTRLGQGWLVQLPEPSRPAFSFGRHVFLSPAHAQLSPTEYAQLVQHEQVHGAQYHLLDLLLAEGVGWFFWFNGLVPYLRRQLRTVHEYLADAAVTQPVGTRIAYGHLLLKLASGPLPASLVHPFSTKQVAQRIHMLTIPPSSPMQKLRFLLVVPIAALAWVGAAALGPAPAVAASSPQATTPATAVQSRIGRITWQGNTLLSTAQLNAALGLKPGDAYDAKALQSRLSYSPDGQDVTSRYMDQGYLFFSINPVAKTQPDGSTDLTFTISEGRRAQIGTITITGNHKVSTTAILEMLPLHTGDFFNRTKLLQSQKILAENGTFDPTSIGINPQPAPRPAAAIDLVNIAFTVVEK
jgi:hypothetical protein